MAVTIKRAAPPIEAVRVSCALQSRDYLGAERFTKEDCRVFIRQGPYETVIRLSKDDAIAFSNALKEAFGGIRLDVDERTGF